MERLSLHIDGFELDVTDEDGSTTLTRVANELACDVYGLRQITFEPGDVAIDIGAHAGLVSLYLAKRWPLVHVHAFEPHPVNHRHCAENIRRNGASNVTLHRLGVNGDGRALVLRSAPGNTGGATAAFDIPGASTVSCEATTLDRILDATLPRGGRCRVLKLDCEGMEYEALENATQLGRVEHFMAEFHQPAGSLVDLRDARHRDGRALTARCAAIFGPGRYRITSCSKED